MVPTLSFLDNTHNLQYINPDFTPTMGKEVIVAIFAGLSIGLVIAFGVWRINSNQTTKLNPIPSTSQNTNSEVVETSDDESTNQLILTGIEDGEIFTSSPITIQGIAAGSKVVAASSETEDQLVKIQADDTFSHSVKLIKGLNQITLIGLTDGGLENHRLTFTVVYYPEFNSGTTN